MRSYELLTERISPVVFHFTGVGAARDILSSGKFQLSSVYGSIEEQYALPGYPYFLSTTRTRRGGYHSSSYSIEGVLFILDGNWYNQHYKGGSVDYWQNRDPIANYGGRAHEAEDRIFSKSSTIPITGVKAVHVFVDVNEAPDQARARARAALLNAKRAGIPAYFYTDKTAWLNFNTQKTADVSVLTGQDSSRRFSRSRDYIYPWYELTQAKNKEQLSKQALDISKQLQYSYNKQVAIDGLRNDLSNARKPNSGITRETAVKIIAYMQKNRLTSVPQLVDHLADKWASLSTQ